MRLLSATRLVICFTSQEDARRVMEVLPKRMGKYGLTLHPEKTRLVEFRAPRPGDKGQGPRSFDLLGFTLYWGKSRKGKPVVKRQTATSRLRRGLKRVAEWCRLNRHLPAEEQHRTLKQKMLGHYSYYGVTGNKTALGTFAQEVRKTWHRWMARRSQRGMDWERFNQLLGRLPLPGPRIVHSVYRLAAKP